MAKKNTIQMLILVSDVPEYYLPTCKFIYTTIMRKYNGKVLSTHFFEKAEDTHILSISIPEISLFMIIDYLLFTRRIQLTALMKVVSANTQDGSMTIHIEYKEI